MYVFKCLLTRELECNVLQTNRSLFYLDYFKTKGLRVVKGSLS